MTPELGKADPKKRIREFYESFTHFQDVVAKKDIFIALSRTPWSCKAYQTERLRAALYRAEVEKTEEEWSSGASTAVAESGSIEIDYL